MKCAVLCAFVAVLLCQASARVGPTGRYYPFDLKAVLECQRDTIPDTVAPVPRIPLMPNDDDKVWLPAGLVDDPSRSYSLPRGLKDSMFLDGLVNRLLGGRSPLTAPTLPTNEIFNRTMFEVRAGEDFPLRRATRSDFVFPQSGAEGFYEEIDVGFNNLQPAGPAIQPAADAVIDAFASAGLGTAGCTANMTFEWTKLPDEYYPSYVLSGACPTMERCSLPVESGHRCSPNTNPGFLTYVGVLRYDCCYNTVDRWIMRQCGWRAVQIPIVTSCQCRCT